MNTQGYLKTDNTALSFGDAFVGFDVTNSDGDTVYEYKPHWKQFLAHNLPVQELFYGGAVYGGKTFWHLHHHAAHCMKWGKDANTIIFRRNYDDLEGSYITEMNDKLEWNGMLGTYYKDDRKMEWYSGGTTWFRHMQKKKDRFKYQSRQFTLISFDELTEFLEEQYEFMFLRLRSPGNPDVTCQMLSSSNPRGAGHEWVWRRFIKDRESGKVYIHKLPEYKLGGQKIESSYFRRMFLSAKATDNIQGLKNDPQYLGRMQQGMEDGLAEAFISGNWNYFTDKAFPDFSKKDHVIKPFNIPPEWKVIRVLDWGYSDPGYYGWMAHDPMADIVYLIDEVYLMEEGSRGGIKGLKMNVDDQLQMFMDHEKGMKQGSFCSNIWDGVADPSIWRKERDDNCIAELLNKNQVFFRQANNNRRLGKQLFHNRLRRSRETGQPRFMVFSNCTEFIRTFQSLQTKDKDPEDVEKGGEDHPYDAVRYGLVELDNSPTPTDNEGTEFANYPNNQEVLNNSHVGSNMNLI